MGVRYKDWSEPPIGTRVKYVLNGRGMTGWEGEVVGLPYTQPGRYEHRNLVKIKFDDKPTPRACYVSNLERIEDMAVMRNSNLIGPKPEPVKEPKFVGPFRSIGRHVVDANSKVVVKVQFGGHREGGFSEQLPMDEAYDLATVIAEALTEKFSKKEDSSSPF